MGLLGEEKWIADVEKKNGPELHASPQKKARVVEGWVRHICVMMHGGVGGERGDKEEREKRKEEKSKRALIQAQV